MLRLFAGNTINGQKQLVMQKSGGKKTNELTALEVWIEALYAKKDYNKCLQVINNAETKGGYFRVY